MTTCPNRFYDCTDRKHLCYITGEDCQHRLDVSQCAEREFAIRYNQLKAQIRAMPQTLGEEIARWKPEARR